MAAPALMNMSIPNLIASSSNPQAQGAAILQAALKQQQPNPAAPGAPQTPAGPGGISGMMNNGLLSKMFPSMFGGAAGAPPGVPGEIDPNSGLPVTPDVLAGAAGIGPGAGPSPTALTGLW